MVVFYKKFVDPSNVDEDNYVYFGARDYSRIVTVYGVDPLLNNGNLDGGCIRYTLNADPAKEKVVPIRGVLCTPVVVFLRRDVSSLVIEVLDSAGRMLSVPYAVMIVEFEVPCEEEAEFREFVKESKLNFLQSVLTSGSFSHEATPLRFLRFLRLLNCLVPVDQYSVRALDETRCRLEQLCSLSSMECGHSSLVEGDMVEYMRYACFPLRFHE